MSDHAVAQALSLVTRLNRDLTTESRCLELEQFAETSDGKFLLYQFAIFLSGLCGPQLQKGWAHIVQTIAEDVPGEDRVH